MDSRGRLAKEVLLALRKLPISRQNPPISSTRCAASAANYCASRGCYGGAGITNDEFWAVEGDIMRVKTDPESRSLLKVIKKSIPAENLNLSRKKVAHARVQRVQAVRLSKSEAGQEEFWKTYLRRFQNVRSQWEKLYFDEVPEEEREIVRIDKNDPFTILGLKRRDRPYSPVELKSAYREMALKYHPDHNPGQDAEARFEKIWNAYKMLQHKRSWR